MMRYLLAVLLLAGATQAGYVEDVIWLADSSQSLQSIRALLHVPEDSTVWAGGAKVMVFDRDLTRTLAVFEAATNVYSLAYNPRARKVYFGDNSRDVLWVADAATRTVIRSFPASADPIWVEYDSTHDAAYFLCQGGAEVVVVDGATDSVRAVIPVGSHPLEICLDESQDRAYVACSGAADITVIDTRGDSVVGLIPTQGGTSGAVSVQHRHRAYLNGAAGVYVIDTQADTAWLVPTRVGNLTAAPGDDKVYGSAGGAVAVFNCVTDSVRVESLPEAWWWTDRGAVDPVRHRLYTFDDSSGEPYLYSIDTRGDTLFGVLHVSHNHYAVECGGDRVYLSTEGGNVLLMLDGETGNVLGGRSRTFDVQRFEALPATGKVVAWGRIGCYAQVIDPAENRVARCLHIAPFAWTGTPVAGGTKLYTGGEGTDNWSWWFSTDATTGAPLQVVKYDDWWTESFLACDWAHRAYSSSFNSRRRATFVFDTDSDAIIDTLDFGHWYESCAAPECDRAYMLQWTEDTLVAVRPSNNAVTMRLPVGGRGYLAFDSVAHRLYHIGRATGLISVIDCDGDSLLATLQGIDSAPVAVIAVPAFERLFVGCGGSHDLVVLNTRTLDVEARLPFASTPSRFAWDADSAQLFLAVGKTAYALDVATLAVTDSVRTDSGFSWVVWNAEHRRLFGARTNMVYALRLGAGVIGLHGGQSPQPAAGAATVVRGSLVLPSAFSVLTSDFILLDASGRQVAALVSGPNDVSRLSPGVYFIRAEGSRGRGSDGSSRKVIIQK